MTTIADHQLLKRMNRSVLLRLLRAQPGLSRARLAIESGLTKSTVSLLVRELLDEGWLSEAGTAVAEGLGAVVATDARVEPAEHKKFVAAEIAKWSPIIKAAGVYAD